MLARALVVLSLLAAPSVLAAEATHEVFLHEYSGGFHLVPEEIYANVGDVLTFQVTNQGAAPHSLIVCGDEPSPSNACTDTWGRMPPIAANETRPIQFTAKKAGTFEYWCDVPGHKGAGMLGTLVVKGEGASKKGLPAPGIALVALALVALALVRRPRA